MKESLKLAAIVSLVFICAQVCAQGTEETSFVQSLIDRGYDIYLNNPDAAIALCQQALTLAVADDDVYHEGYAALVLTKSYWVKANYRLSTEYGFRALKAFEDTSFKEEYGIALVSVARTLVELGNFEKANEMLSMAEKISKHINDQRLLASTKA